MKPIYLNIFQFSTGSALLSSSETATWSKGFRPTPETGKDGPSSPSRESSSRQSEASNAGSDRRDVFPLG